MAKQGNYAALQRLTPTQGLSDDVQYWNNDGYKRRQEARVEDSIQYEKQLAKKQREEDLYDKYVKPGKAYDTGSKSLNEVIARGLSEARDQYLPNLKILEDPNASREDQIKARLRLDNLNKLPEHYKLVTQKYSAEWDAYKKAKESGTAWQNQDLERTFQNGFETFELGLDEQMRPTVAFVDKNKDGKNDLLGVQTFDEISKGMPLFDWQKKYTMENMAKGIADIAGKTDVTEVTNGGFGEKRVEEVKFEALKMGAEKVLYDQNGAPTEAAISFMRQRGMNYQSPNPDDLKKIEQDFISLSKSYTDYLKEESIDSGAQTSRIRENRLGSEKEKTAFKLTQPVKPSEEVWSSKFININPKAKSVGVNGIVLDAVRDGEEVITDATVKNVTYDREGNMMVDISYEDQKSASYRAEQKDFLEELILRKESAQSEGVKQELDKEIKKVGLELDRISTGAKNKRKVVTIPKEDEAAVAGPLGGIETLRSRAFPDGVPEFEAEEEAVVNWGEK
jgi:hypothetical protein